MRSINISQIYQYAKINTHKIIFGISIFNYVENITCCKFYMCVCNIYNVYVRCQINIGKFVHEKEAIGLSPTNEGCLRLLG